MHWKDWCWSWNFNLLATWYKELTHWKRPWCWERLKAGGEGDNRGWDGWMASTQWTWVWASSRSSWWTGRPGVLQSMGLQGVVHDWVTELNWTERIYDCIFVLTVTFRMDWLNLPKGDQSWVFFGRTDVKAEAPILWPPDAKSWLIGKDPDAGKNWG